MEEIEKVGFLVKSSHNITECIRSAVGLGLDNRQVAVFIIDAAIEDRSCTDEFLDRLEMIDDLEGLVWTNVEPPQPCQAFIRQREVKEIAREMAGCDLLVSF